MARHESDLRIDSFDALEPDCFVDVSLNLVEFESKSLLGVLWQLYQRRSKYRILVRSPDHHTIQKRM